MRKRAEGKEREITQGTERGGRRQWVRKRAEGERERERLLKVLYQ